MLKNKKILLAVTGSVSFYKAYEILSLLKKMKADVYVMLSDGALKFCNYESFEALCDHKVLCSKTQSWQDGLNHISFGKVDVVIIAPATVNTINKLANGIADCVFMETLLATRAPLIIAPAANTAMLEHFTTKKSLQTLRENGATIVSPATKTLACGEMGVGALADESDIIASVFRVVLADPFYKNKTVLVTAGPTYEKLDDVRAITNLSSGKMGKALADAFYSLGANVIFISSVNFQTPYKFIKFESSIGLEAAMQSQNLKPGDIVVMAAAVSDYLPIRIKGKIKKDESEDIFTFKFKKNKDIISSVKFVDGVKKIGFKLECNKEDALDNAKKMLKQKSLDAVCLNVLDETVKFGSDDTTITFITNKTEVNFKKDEKINIAYSMAEHIKKI